jgi:anhydro-N-acetylmuramic acid kinase
VTIVGIMSGSSIDGLDLAACSFDDRQEALQWSILDFVTVPYSPEWYERLKNAPQLSGHDLMQLDADFGNYIGQEVKGWMNGKNRKIDCIASHGHTVFHEPALGFTTQIGSGAHITAVTGIDSITNFRAADVAHGGQGAPFAPAADRILFPDYDAYLNLGGIANIFLNTADDRWLAWDIGPCNQALNYLAQRAGHSYDQGGVLASQGAVLDAIRHDLIAMFPFHGGNPLSISNAKVRSTWIEYLELRNEDAGDLLSSATLAIADMISLHLSPVIKRPSRVLVTGGGAYNDHLIHLLRRLGMDFGINYEIPSTHIIDHKESLLMAYLGYLTMHEKPFGIHRITGAAIDAIGGSIHKAI